MAELTAELASGCYAGRLMLQAMGRGDQKQGKIMDTIQDHCCIRVFKLAEGREVRLYCRLVKARRNSVAAYSLYEDFRGRQWLEMAVGGRVWLEELVGETFEQRVAADLLTLGLNKYSG